MHSLAGTRNVFELYSTFSKENVGHTHTIGCTIRSSFLAITVMMLPIVRIA
jgi:hypothetical protein